MNKSKLKSKKSFRDIITNELKEVIKWLIESYRHNKLLISIIGSIILVLISIFIKNAWDILLASLNLTEIILSRIKEILSYNFFGILNFETKLVIISLILIYLTIYTIIKIYYFFFEKNEKINWWIIGTILIMGFFFVIGIFIIDDSSTGKLEIQLNDEYNNLSRSEYKLTCENDRVKRMYDVKYNCNVINISNENVITLKNISWNLFMYNENKSIFGKDNITFKVPENSSHILIKLSGSHNNQSLNLSSGVKFNFISKKDELKSKNEFRSKLFILITIIFISIPSMMANFRKLNKKIKK